MNRIFSLFSSFTFQVSARRAGAQKRACFTSSAFVPATATHFCHSNTRTSAVTMPSSNALLLAAGGALVVAAGAYFVKSGQSPSSVTSRELADLDDIDDHDSGDCITEADVCAVFDQLFVHMQSVLAQLSQQIQQIQMSGQQIPEAQLRQLLRQEFERALTAAQSQIFEENDMDEDCLQEATWEFLSEPDKYPKAKKAVERFQKLYENVTGEKIVGRRPGDGGGSALEAKSATAAADISQEQLLKAAEVYFDSLTEAMGDIVKRMKAEGKNLRDPSVAQPLQMEFASNANDAGEAALEREGSYS